MEENAFESQQRIDSYLKQQGLAQWHRVLKDRKVRSLFDLLDKSEGNVYARLRALDLDYTYGIYKSQSMIIHGSTFVQLFHWIEDTVGPKFFSADAEAETSAKSIGETCRFVLVMLAFMQRDLWNRD